ncbi:DUF3631 domain-containing protein [Actinoalloteichus sp. GBA129-24]|uniref:DUF3631 domain-containing protein n=1 Tax=Actinoalloteichus sp. GBA129-24 TaxID=1612551 RepID=UPI0009506065|nr:DUF3631 domain-containing protein [Actinoalloteichus sp. GBA129-24]APU18611.1 putative DUF3631 family protein [Actinoalloteichus sp. GBA129-24]
MTAAQSADGVSVLDALREALTRYVVLPSPQAADAVCLWIAATHAQPAWAHAPRLVIRAPEKRCGKSRLLDVVEATCRQPLITVNASPAAVYRSITSDPPVLLVDEADTIFGPKTENEDLRGLLNAGHQRNRPAIRYDATNNRVESIPTFAMAALAGIGAMPDTIEDRAVVIHMRRRAPGETVAPYRHRRDRPRLQKLATTLTEWLRADLPALEAAEPAMPVEDRAADTWEPLVIVADHAGGHWPDRARAAVTALTADAAGDNRAALPARLLLDCRTAFTDHTALPTATLLERLNSDLEAPWREIGTNGLTAMKLGQMLAEYHIRSRNIRFRDGQAKGFDRADFTDAWLRYCPPEPDQTHPNRGESSQPSQPSLPSSQRDGLTPRDGSSRPAQDSRPALTSTATPGTPGTATPLTPAA